jgi:UDP-N-acetyl-D-mannosaminuronate dehydrogenase
VLERLQRKGALVSYHDSFVDRCTIGEGEQGSMPLDVETIGAQDLVVLLTPHPDVDIHALVNSAAMVFDARGVTVGVDAPNVVRL